MNVFRSLPVDQLVVSTQKRWLVDDLASGVRGRCQVVHDWGLDLPEVSAETSSAWWVPAGHAARLVLAGVRLDFAAPGSGWLVGLGRDLLGRHVSVSTIADLCSVDGGGFVKLAEAKIAGVEAQWVDDVCEFVAVAVEAGVPADAVAQVSDRRLDLVEEHRCFVVGDRVAASCPYLRHPGRQLWEPGWEHDGSFAHGGAVGFATEVVVGLGDGQPPAYVLDVGLCVDGSWVVVEANPAWCSGPYGADMAGVVDTVVAASATGPVAPGGSRHGSWVWRPDPSLVTEAAAQPLLVRRRSVVEQIAAAQST